VERDETLFLPITCTFDKATPMKYCLTALCAIVLLIAPGLAQTIVPLYPNGVPNSKPAPDAEKSTTDSLGVLRISNVSIPTLTIFPPTSELATGAAVIIFPGGGYQRLSFSKEGTDVAKRFNEMGVTAFVVKYRLPNDETMMDKSIAPIQDAQRAIELVRENAKEWGIDPKRVGIIGFSAGGHLAATAGTHYNHPYIDVKKRTNLRPDFMILVYPVISFADSLTHRGSIESLVGKNPSPEKVQEFSNELHVNKKTPPTFIIHAEDDQTVKIQNALVFATALQKNKVPFNFHFYEKGGHGFGLNNSTSDVKWMDIVQGWLRDNGWLNKTK
jgi:acetyl esterase/lipase